MVHFTQCTAPVHVGNKKILEHRRPNVTFVYVDRTGEILVQVRLWPEIVTSLNDAFGNGFAFIESTKSGPQQKHG